MNLAEELATHFAVRGFQWVDAEGNAFVPGVKEFEQALDSLRELVYARREQVEEGEYVTVEAGRLYVSDQDGKMDVYAWVGSLDDE